MSSLAVRAYVRRPMRRLAIVLAVLVVGGAVVAHHAMPDMSGMAAGAACLFVLGVTAVVTAAAAAVGPARPRPASMLPLPVARVPAPRSVPARAGPLYLALLVLRR